METTFTLHLSSPDHGTYFLKTHQRQYFFIIFQCLIRAIGPGFLPHCHLDRPGFTRPMVQSKNRYFLFRLQQTDQINEALHAYDRLNTTLEKALCFNTGYGIYIIL